MSNNVENQLMNSNVPVATYNRNGESVEAMQDLDFDIDGKTEVQDSRFNCNICLDPVSEPVVTQCGHLYCWPCLYRWLEPGITNEEHSNLMERHGSPPNDTIFPRFRNAPVNRSRRVCPVCKSNCIASTIIPIYVREGPPKRGKGPTQNTTDSNEEELSKTDTDETCPNDQTDILNEETQSDVMNGSVTDNTGLRRRIVSATSSGDRVNSVQGELDETSMPLRPLPPPATQSQESTGDPHQPIPNSHTPYNTRVFLNQAGMYFNREINEMDNPNGGVQSGGSTQSSLHQSQSLFQALLGMQVHPQHPHHPQESSSTNFIPSIHRSENHGQRRESPSQPLDASDLNSRSHMQSSVRSAGEESERPSMQSIDQNVLYSTGELTRGDDAMEYLSRLLLMLASFVVLCLLLF